MDGSDYYIPAAAMGIAFAVKLPGTIRAWRDPLVRSVCVLLGLAAATFFFAAPPTIAQVNRITGIPNFSGPLVYAILTACNASILVLIIYWRGDRPEQTRRLARRWVVGYSLVALAIVALFALGHAPVERLRDLDTYYAHTPFIREMIVVYLLGHMVASVVTTVMCWGWAREVRGRAWLHRGLVVLVVGFVLDLVFGIAKLTAVFARWFGVNWDALSTHIAPVLVSLGGMTVVAGFLLPLLGPQLTDICRAWLTYWRLGPLWRELHPLPCGAGLAAVRMPWWAPPDLRVTLRETEIHDGLLGLKPYFDDAVRTRTHERAIGLGLPVRKAQVAGEAAMVAAAVAAQARAVAQGRARTEEDCPGPDGARPAFGPGSRELVRVSRALQSPLVAAAREEAARAESSTR